jgi:large subunit ribosomal protein L1
MTKKIIAKARGSKKYQNNVKILAEIKKTLGTEILSLKDAVDSIYKFEQASFKNGATVEVHFNLLINTTKSDQLVRSSVVLPHGTGKEVKIVAFVNPENVGLANKLGCYKVGGEDLIEEIKASGKVDFDIAIAEPEMMKKLPAIARILGTAGVMPNPKTGTVGSNLEEIVKLIKSGKVDYKNDKAGNVHFAIGKINKEFTAEKILSNLETAIDSLEKAKPEALKKKFINSISISTTMSPSIKLR